MPPKILISRAAARSIFDEVQRWVELGLRRGGSALESLVYPLSALVPGNAAVLTPLELAPAVEIAQLVIDAVAIPPDEIKVFSAANCHFAADEMGPVNDAFNQHIDRLIARRPRLGAHSKLHTHPFAGGAFLSAGDLYHGVAAPGALAWRERRGLATAVLHVVYPDSDPFAAARPWRLTAGGALARDGRRSCRWRVRSWASDPAGEMLDLGDAELVSNRHPSVRAARRAPYWQTRRGARWCDAQKAALRAAGYAVSRNLLGRGWRRYLLRAGTRQLLFAIPPDFPRLGLRVLEIRRAWTNDFTPLDLPPRLASGSFSLSLPQLARHFGRPT